MTLKATTFGTLGQNLLGLRLALRGARRAEFVPARSLDLDIVCQTHAEDIFHRLADLNCAAPADTLTPALTLTGNVPQAFAPSSATLNAQLHKLDAAFLLDALRLASPRVEPALRLTGSLTGAFTLLPAAGQLNFADPQLRLGDSPPFITTGPAPDSQTLPPISLAEGKLSFGPIPLALGGTATLEGQADRTGYTLHLTGTALRSRLLSLAEALPQFGDGLPTALPAATPTTTAIAATTPEIPIHLDLAATRTWAGGQTWTATPPRPTPHIPARHHRR